MKLLQLSRPCNPLDAAADRLRGQPMPQGGSDAVIVTPLDKDSCKRDKKDAGLGASPPEVPCGAAKFQGLIRPQRSHDAFKFFCLQQKAEEEETKTDPDPKVMVKYVSAGITLSNELCDAWFQRLGVAQVTLRQTSDAISSAGSLTQAIMAFAKSNTRSMGLTASVFGVSKQTVDTLAANYIVAVDLTSVATAVREYRGLYAQKILQTPTAWNYYSARSVIMAYDNTCSALSVKQFINTRVSGDGGADVDKLTDAAINRFLDDTGGFFGATLTAAQLVDVYAYLFVPEASADIRQKLLADLPDALKDDKGVKFKPGGKGQGAFKMELAYDNIDQALMARALARVEQLKAMSGGSAPGASTEGQPPKPSSSTPLFAVPVDSRNRPLDVPPKP